MDDSIVIFWLVLGTCLYGLALISTRFHAAGIGWAVLYLTTLVVDILGWFFHQPALIYAAAGMWVLFVLVPGAIGKLYQQRLLQKRYSGARRLAQIIRFLHPGDGWREQPKLIRALELAQQGELTTASEILQRLQGLKSTTGLAAILNLYQLTGRWEEFLLWQSLNSHALERSTHLLPFLLRARGETGDLRGMVELYDRRKSQIRKLIPPSTRDLCRLPLFAFCGRRPAVEGLFAGSLAAVPAPTREFWLATADMAAGKLELAKRQFDSQLPSADAPLRLAIERRLARLTSQPPPLDAAAEQVVDEAAREHGHDENFTGRRSLFSKYARATQIFIVLNVAMFVVETRLGGATNEGTLFRLGALYPPAVHAGQWWRLLASLFLHFGWLHLTMNMLALWILGPFTEFALGFRRYSLLYLLSGIGSMFVVMHLGSGADGEQMTLGASGSIMGLVGATAALMLRGWRQHKALSARRRLTALLLIIALQSLSDSVVPQVSMTGHLSGAVIGFVIALLLRDRLGAAASGPNPTEMPGNR